VKLHAGPLAQTRPPLWNVDHVPATGAGGDDEPLLSSALAAGGRSLVGGHGLPCIRGSGATSRARAPTDRGSHSVTVIQ